MSPVSADVLRARVAARMSSLLFSSRPRWAFMPGYVASNFVDNLMFLLSALEQAGIQYCAHFGTLLGALRLRGVNPWDEDADIYVIDEDRASIERKLGAVLEQHGFDLVYDPRDFFWVRQSPWWAGQGHIGLSFLPKVGPYGFPPPTHWEDPSLAPEELYPLQRLPFYGTWFWAPGAPEPIMRRLYGETGSVATMTRFTPPAIDAETDRFWREARADLERLDWPAISARFQTRREKRRFAHVHCFPWWWANGAYNVGIQKLRAAGRALSRP